MLHVNLHEFFKHTVSDDKYLKLKVKIMYFLLFTVFKLLNAPQNDLK